MTYRVVIHGFPTRDDARRVAGMFAGQSFVARAGGHADAGELSFGVEPDDIATAEADPYVEAFDADDVAVLAAIPDPPAGRPN